MSDSQEISAQVEEPAKRKRGRPKKIALDPSEQKRSRGRPKGSKNKNPPKVKIIDNKPKRPRGRPRKTNPEEKETIHPVQSKDSAEDITTD